MSGYSIPLIDEHNPLYCPAVPAYAYIGSLRRRLRSAAPSQDQKWLFSFARILDRALVRDEDTHLDHQYYPPLPITSTNSEDPSLVQNPAGQAAQDIPPSRQLKRKRSSSFTDLRGPAKHARSLVTFDSPSSFTYSPKRERLRYSLTKSSETRCEARRVTSRFDRPGNIAELTLHIRDLEDELYGPRIGAETPRSVKSLINRLDLLLPGIRLRQRLHSLVPPTHQNIADLLGADGLLTPSVLNTLRTSEIRSLSLTASIDNEDGLNLAGPDVFRVFSKPNSFLSLTELSFNGTLVQDFDLTHIHHLPNLSFLHMHDTGISDESIFILTTLKRTLAHLSVSSNPLITNDSVPALLVLSNLYFLSILDTSIDMHGLRLLAKTIQKEGRIIDIQIPIVCDEYIDNIPKLYELNPIPPLITNPSICGQLSIMALKRNLEGHAKVNKDIVTEGTRAEMVERLERVLKMREGDLVVREMVFDEDGC